ncbi:hypothetical protein Rs2_29162 [Raphanus sativus]|nr:hypothetical protein Rs2_29162 [Raphanus sativus]
MSVWPPGARDVGLAARRTETGCRSGRPAPRMSVWPPSAQDVSLAARRLEPWRASCFFRKISTETPIEAKRKPFCSRLKGEQSELVLGRTGKTEFIPWLVDLYAHGLVALAPQLHLLDITGPPFVDKNNPLAKKSMEAYEKMGDAIAMQYAGSDAHYKMFTALRGHWNMMMKHCYMITVVRPHYNNAYMDSSKQNAINM